MGNRQAAQTFFNQAVTAVNDKANPQHLNIAYQLFSSATLADPGWILPHYYLGNANCDLEKIPAAIAAWRRALECRGTDQERAMVMVNLGWKLFSMGDVDGSVYYSNAALELWPQAHLAYINLAYCAGLVGGDQAAIGYAREFVKKEPDDVQGAICLAFALLFAGQYQEGFKLFENRFEWKLQQFLHYPYPKWNGNEGKTIWLAADQGLGDTFSFCRFLRQACARSKHIHASVQPELIRAMTFAFSDVPNLSLWPMGSPFQQADAWSTFVSLPSALNLTDAEVRNSEPPKWPRVPVQTDWRVPDRKLHIGITWRGSALNPIDKHRNIPMEQFLELYRVPGVQLYSLQVADGTDELMKAGCYSVIRDLTPWIRDVADTISVLDHLDLVITVESALGHICGAIGKECWVPYSFLGRDYRAGNSGENPLWYNKHRFYKQGRDLKWGPVFDTIIRDLETRR